MDGLYGKSCKNGWFVLHFLGHSYLWTDLSYSFYQFCTESPIRGSTSWWSWQKGGIEGMHCGVKCCPDLIDGILSIMAWRRTFSHWQFHHNFIIPNWHTEALVWQGKSGRIILNLLCKKFFGQISVQYIGVIPSRSKPDCWIRIMGHQLKAFDVDCWLVQSICSCFCTLVSRKSAWNLGSSQAVHTDLLKVMGTFSRLSGYPVHPSLIGKLMNMISVNDVEVGRLKMLPVWWAHKRCRDLANFFQRFQNHRIEPLSSLTSLDVW